MAESNTHTQFLNLSQQISTCEKCPRLVIYRSEVARVKRRAFRDADYWGRPVPGFGDEDARVLLLGWLRRSRLQSHGEDVHWR